MELKTLVLKYVRKTTYDVTVLRSSTNMKRKTLANLRRTSVRLTLFVVLTLAAVVLTLLMILFYPVRAIARIRQERDHD